MEEEDMEKKIEFIAITTLGALKGIMQDNKLDDRKATLTLYYFINRFVKNGWKGNKPSEVLKNAIEVIKETDDSSIPPTQNKSP